MLDWEHIRTEARTHARASSTPHVADLAKEWLVSLCQTLEEVTPDAERRAHNSYP